MRSVLLTESVFRLAIMIPERPLHGRAVHAVQEKRGETVTEFSGILNTVGLYRTTAETRFERVVLCERVRLCKVDIPQFLTTSCSANPRLSYQVWKKHLWHSALHTNMVRRRTQLSNSPPSLSLLTAASALPLYLTVPQRRRRRGGPTTVAVRVCTDCHISLQTVTVATALGDGGGSVDREADGPPHGGSAPRSPAVNGDKVPSRGGTYEVSVPGAGRQRRTGVVGGVVELLQDVFVGEDFAGYFGGPRFHGRAGVHAGGGGFVDDLEAFEGATVSEIPGDVVLADVVEWGRIEVRSTRRLLFYFF